MLGPSECCQGLNIEGAVHTATPPGRMSCADLQQTFCRRLFAKCSSSLSPSPGSLLVLFTEKQEMAAVRKMFLLTVSLFRLPARAFDRGPVAFWSPAPTRDSSLPWTRASHAWGGAQPLMHGMLARIPRDNVRCTGFVDSPGVGGRKC